MDNDYMNSFKDKVALVTGGTSGIGKATAFSLAKRQSKIIIAARKIDRGVQVEQELKNIGADASFIPTDISIEHEVKNLIQQIADKHGQLNFACNCAATYTPGAFANIAEFDEYDFDNVISVNLKGTWLSMKYEIQQMTNQKNKGGAIVNVASVVGMTGVATASIYSATKAGVIALTKSAAKEYAPHHIRINSVSPGLINTPMLDEAYNRRSENDMTRKKNLLHESSKKISLGRIGEPEEVAEAIVWLGSNAAAYITGQNIVINGG